MQVNITTDELVTEIVQKVITELKSFLTEGRVTEEIMDIDALSVYLKVTKSWIYQNQKSLPHFRVGRFIRYRKSEIDRWLETQKIPPRKPLSNRIRRVK